jgi:VWFA-related protein
MNRASKFLLLLAVLALSPLLANAQQQPAPRRKTLSQEAQDKIRVETNLVVLAVTVKDARGNLVSGLAQQDFHVFEDSVEQQITAFTDEGLPLSLIILVDADMKWKQGSAMAKSLRAVASGLSDTDEAMVCRYDMLFYPGANFTNVYGNLMVDLKATQAAAEPAPQYIPPPLVTGVSSTTGPPVQAAPVYASHRPSKAIEDALFSSAELLDQRPRGRRRVILLISDGDNEPKLNHHTHSEVLEQLLRQNISVYTLAVGAQRAKHKFSDVVDYSTQTGGDIFYATQTDQMEILYSRITEQARHDYVLAYTPPNHSASTPEFHAIRVAVSTPNQTASTRSGYYSTPSDPSTPQP